ncbi:MAG: BTAD domain-containing putative transcriptional regulator, partial [Chloroflexota bacterium]|nr:BTAD domain-containing putative transcriptional regulator [Chloroflexota bacterium]
MEIQRNHFYIRLLSPIQVEQNNQLVQGFESRKALALLGYLAAQNCPVSREKIVAIFWGEKTEKLGRGNLRRVLHNLNQILPGCLKSDRYTLQLKRSPVCQCDIDLFTQFEKQSQLSTQAQAIDLYKGDFMEGLYLDNCPEFETWLTTEQEHWRQRVARILDSLVIDHGQRGEYESALDFAQRLLSLTPWRESAHRQLMTLFARNGQRSEALRQYQHCQQMLADEFSAEPAPETTELYQQIQSAENRTRFELPTPVAPFVGRKRELAEISQLLASPDCRLLTLAGLGGMGKTRLALRYAALNQDTFLDGVAFIPLAALDDPGRVVYALAQSLELSIGDVSKPTAQIFNYLHNKEILLVLDNFEHLLNAATLLSDLLNSAPSVKLLVTSRERLNLRGEWVFPLDGLSVGQAVAPPGKVVAS